MTVGILPFATELMADYLRADHGQRLAAGVYAGSFLLMAVAFAILHRHILLNSAHLLKAEIPLEERRRILTRSVSGLAPYLIATILAVVSGYASLAICGALALFYATPVAGGGATPPQ